MMILGFFGVGFMVIVVGIRPLSQPDQIDIANTETAFGRSFCLRSTLPHCGKRKPKRDR